MTRVTVASVFGVALAKPPYRDTCECLGLWQRDGCRLDAKPFGSVRPRRALATRTFQAGSERAATSGTCARCKWSAPRGRRCGLVVRSAAAEARARPSHRVPRRAHGPTDRQSTFLRAAAGGVMRHSCDCERSQVKSSQVKFKFPWRTVIERAGEWRQVKFVGCWVTEPG